MRMGHVGPNTLPKWRIKGTRFVLKRVSTMTAALLVIEPLKGFMDSENPSSFGLGFAASPDEDGILVVASGLCSRPPPMWF